MQLCRGRVGRERARGPYRCSSLNQVRRRAAGRRRPAGEGQYAVDGASARRWLPSARASGAPDGVMPSGVPPGTASARPPARRRCTAMHATMPVGKRERPRLRAPACRWAPRRCPRRLGARRAAGRGGRSSGDGAAGRGGVAGWWVGAVLGRSGALSLLKLPDDTVHFTSFQCAFCVFPRRNPAVRRLPPFTQAADGCRPAGQQRGWGALGVTRAARRAMELGHGIML
jgi:hypothetical protein